MLVDQEDNKPIEKVLQHYTQWWTKIRQAAKLLIETLCSKDYMGKKNNFSSGMWIRAGSGAGFSYGILRTIAAGNSFPFMILFILFWGICGALAAGLGDKISRKIQSELISWLAFGAVAGLIISIFKIFLVLYARYPFTVTSLIAHILFHMLGFSFIGLIIFIMVRKRVE